MKETIFNKIVAKEVSSRVVYEDRTFIAFLDVAPWTKGHTILIPKEQFERVTDLPPRVLTKMLATAQKIMKLLEEKLFCKSFNVMFNDGPFSGQEIPAVHMHIIPRYNRKEVAIEHKRHTDNLDKILSLIKH